MKSYTLLMTVNLRHKYILKNLARVIIDTKLPIFQYKILNKVLYLNKKLFKF